MKVLIISLGLGIVAGILDVIPMVLKKLDPLFIGSAFIFWLVVAVMISRSGFFSPGWLNGIATAWLLLLPLLPLIAKVDRGALPVVMVSTTVLGGVVGLAGSLIF